MRRCEPFQDLVVAWQDSGGSYHAAACDVEPDGPKLKAMSWLLPAEWPEPMLNLIQPPELVRANAFSHIRAVLEERAELQEGALTEAPWPHHEGREHRLAPYGRGRSTFFRVAQAACL
jgi:hypothetical protein